MAKSSIRTVSPTILLDSLAGETLDDFRILRLLGRSRVGETYLAEQLSRPARVAVKILNSRLAADPACVERFRVEARASMSCKHSAIVPIQAVQADNERAYLIREYVDGANMGEHLRRTGVLPWPFVLRAIHQVASALTAASEHGMVHGDIKPENILLRSDGEVKVTDFGLANALDSLLGVSLSQSHLAEAALYMSPEQLKRRPADLRSDIYSLGITCYHLLAGRPPFQGETSVKIAFNHLHGQPKPLAELRPDLPGEVCAVIHKMMAREPADRYASGRDLQEAIDALPSAAFADASEEFFELEAESSSRATALDVGEDNPVDRHFAPTPKPLDVEDDDTVPSEANAEASDKTFEVENDDPVGVAPDVELLETELDLGEGGTFSSPDADSRDGAASVSAADSGDSNRLLWVALACSLLALGVLLFSFKRPFGDSAKASEQASNAAVVPEQSGAENGLVPVGAGSPGERLPGEESQRPGALTPSPLPVPFQPPPPPPPQENVVQARIPAAAPAPAAPAPPPPVRTTIIIGSTIYPPGTTPRVDDIVIPNWPGLSSNGIPPVDFTPTPTWPGLDPNANPNVNFGGGFGGGKRRNRNNLQRFNNTQNNNQIPAIFNRNVASPLQGNGVPR